MQHAHFNARIALLGVIGPRRRIRAPQVGHIRDIAQSAQLLCHTCLGLRIAPLYTPVSCTQAIIDVVCGRIGLERRLDVEDAIILQGIKGTLAYEARELAKRLFKDALYQVARCVHALIAIVVSVVNGPHAKEHMHEAYDNEGQSAQFPLGKAAKVVTCLA